MTEYHDPIGRLDALDEVIGTIVKQIVSLSYNHKREVCEGSKEFLELARKFGCEV